MLLSFIALTPASLPFWTMTGAWLVPVVLIAMVVLVGDVPPAYRNSARRVAAALVLASVLSAGLIASELIRQDVPECASLEPYSALWFAFGCWWPF